MDRGDDTNQAERTQVAVERPAEQPLSADQQLLAIRAATKKACGNSSINEVMMNQMPSQMWG